MSLLEPLWRALFPPRCVGCGKHGEALCTSCARGLPYMPSRVCQRCATPTVPRMECRACRRLSPALNSVRAAFVYEGVPRRAVHTFKFRSGRYLAPVLGELLRASLEQRPLHADLVTPVPLAPRRLRERGYNQAALLAEYVTDAAGASLATGLLAREDRPPQQRLSAAERMDNLLGAIRCTDPSAASHRRILLVDDVMTTGATLSACAEALADAGASHVSALVFARDV